MSRDPLLLVSLIAVSLSAACTFGAPDGSGSPGDDVPDGQVEDDRDGDGMPNVADNCPEVANLGQEDGDVDDVGDACDNCVAAKNPRLGTMGFDQPIQRDHDGDGRGDECDLCPHLASPTSNADADTDGIGDACDPEPAAANPAPYWNGFYDAPDTLWSAVAGTAADWELAPRGGKLGWQQKTLDQGRHQLLHTQRHQESFIQSSIIVDAIADSTVPALRSATVTYGYERITAQDAYYSCGMMWNTTGLGTSSLVVGLQHDDLFTAEVSSTGWTGGFVGKTIDVTGRGDRTGSSQPNSGNSALRCGGADGAMVQSAAYNSIQRPDGQIGLRTFGMTAWFDYVFVVEPRPR